ncbi:MAG: type III-B CRISPR module RAMP protein Cmr1 [Magnetococcus sp. DMHC-6]
MTHRKLPDLERFILPERRSHVLTNNERKPLTISLQTITPIFGGGFKAAELDDVDIIRIPAIRGHLRFWWRALYGQGKDLYEREKKLWGGVNSNQSGSRSPIDVRIEGMNKLRSHENDNIIRQELYALWPAKMENIYPRYAPGLQFTLKLLVPGECISEIKNTLRAWILFGGYGSRTRRGVGSLTVVDNCAEWLPRNASREALVSLFGIDILAPTERAADDLPQLGGAFLLAGANHKPGRQVWQEALKWLREFRQGTQYKARKSGPPGDHRPSISNWPEADKLRQLSTPPAGGWSHPPRYDATMAWPRAGFGLPINGQFQRQKRGGGVYHEPKDFKLHWEKSDQPYKRLASPVIVKAMPLANNMFIPIALWLNRAYPEGGQVVLEGDDSTPRRSAAPFDRLKSPTDQAIFPPLATAPNLREVFQLWLINTYHLQQVAP